MREENKHSSHDSLGDHIRGQFISPQLQGIPPHAEAYMLCKGARLSVVHTNLS